MNMYFEEYGKEHDQVIVFLHGANFVHAFGKQYELASKYHLYVPHIMGYGNEADTVFEADRATNALIEFIEELDKKVLLVGFSLGAQLAYMIVSRRPDLLTGCIMVSPWLIKDEPMLSNVIRQNEKQFKSFKKKGMCSLIGLMNGLPKAQRAEFVEQMQHVQLETVHNAVDNHVTLDSEPGFVKAQVRMLALAGAKEPDEVKNSIYELANMNENCVAEVWEKAAHNIPPMFAKQFNKVIDEYMV